MAFEHYMQSGGKRLRLGYTTGTCAALAAMGAARRLLTGCWPETVSLITPKGIPVEVPLLECAAGEDFASCAVRKDAGDDVDCTAGMLIFAEVRELPEKGEDASRNPEERVRICGGPGVGRVTKPGLDQPVGEAAINRVPRRMIREAVESVCRIADYPGGLQVTISIPEGEAAAAKTFNPQLGIEGGLSVLGTSGIVEPMSRQALVDTIGLALSQRAALGDTAVILTPGNIGEGFLRDHGYESLGVPVVRCSNFIGDSLELAAGVGFREILLAGHIGKLVKVAGGIMNTHSHQADCRRELFCAHAAVSGASRSVCRELMDCVSTDSCVAVLRREGLLEVVMESLMEEISRQLGRHLPEECLGGALVFSGEQEILGITPEGERLLSRWKKR